MNENLKITIIAENTNTGFYSETKIGCDSELYSDSITLGDKCHSELESKLLDLTYDVLIDKSVKCTEINT